MDKMNQYKHLLIIRYHQAKDFPQQILQMHQ